MGKQTALTAVPMLEDSAAAEVAAEDCQEASLTLTPGRQTRSAVKASEERVAGAGGEASAPKRAGSAVKRKSVRFALPTPPEGGLKAYMLLFLLADTPTLYG